MKKLTLSLVAAASMAASLGAYAAIPTGAAPFQVVVPNLKSGIEVTLEGLYLQPSNSDLVYGNTVTSYIPAGPSTVPSPSSLTSTSTASNLNSVDPKHEFGFRVGLGYIFPNSGNDVQLNWTHFDHSYDDAATSTWVTSAPLASTTETLSSHATSDVNFKLDSLDLDVGQYVSVGTRLQTRFFVGLRGARLDNDVANVATGTATTAVVGSSPSSNVVITNTEVANFHSKFEGVGPRVGIDTSYMIGNCFGLAGHFATALLVGRADSDVAGSVTISNTQLRNDQSTASTVTTVKNGSVDSDRQTRVVPAFDAKLGLDYSFPFKNNSSSLNFEAGWQVTQYIDPIDRVHGDFTSTSASATSVTTSSVGFNGPYLSLNFKA